jgi:hypothetical protein
MMRQKSDELRCGLSEYSDLLAQPWRYLGPLGAVEAVEKVATAGGKVDVQAGMGEFGAVAVIV